MPRSEGRGRGRGRGRGKLQRKKSLPPQGTGTKRTPSGHFDAASGGDLYTPEKIVAERKAKSICPCSSCESNNGTTETQWQVKWVGHASKHNTWEPVTHVAGNEQMIKTFRIDLAKKNAAFQKQVAEEKAKRKGIEARKKLEQTVAAAAANFSDDSDGSTGTVVQISDDDDSGGGGGAGGGGKHKSKRRNKSSVWSIFEVLNKADDKQKMATCTHAKVGGSMWEETQL
jgi:hypothetical protein